MTENVKVKKIWIYILYIWIGLGVFTIFYFKTHDMTEIYGKDFPFLVPFIIFNYLLFCCIFLKQSKIFEFLKGRIGNLFFGIITIIFSLHQLHSDEAVKHWGTPIPQFAFVISLFIGVCFLLFGTFYKVKDKSSFILICMECKATFNSEANSHKTCPKCNGTVVSYKSFIEQGNSFVNDKS